MAYFVTEGRYFTATASETITAGDFVKALSVTGVTDTSSLLENYTYVMKSDAAGDENLTVGIAVESGTVGSKIGVATEGLYLVKAGAAVTAGQPFKAFAAAGSADAASDPVAAAGSWEAIGRSLNDAQANEYFFGVLRI
jgi:hypothetical protein